MFRPVQVQYCDFLNSLWLVFFLANSTDTYTYLYFVIYARSVYAIDSEA